MAPHSETMVLNMLNFRKNPWFNKNLPAYLRPLPNTEESGNILIDDDLVFELSKKMGYSTQVIQKALSEPDNNQFKVAYQLVVDHKRLLQDCKLVLCKKRDGSCV